MKTRFRVGCLLLVVFAACTETFEVNAPYQDIFAVYGVLDPHQDTQYVRISLAFQPEENAYDLAKTIDLSVRDLNVSLSGNGKTYSATFADSIPKRTEGDFVPFAGAYRFITAGSDRLIAGSRYELRISREDDSTFWLAAATRIPPQPLIISPTRYDWQGEYCLPIVDVEDTVSVVFRKNDRPDNRSSHFEIRWLLRYEVGGEHRELQTIPSPPFNRNVRCGNAGNGNLCFSTGNGSVLEEWLTSIPLASQGLNPEIRCSQIPIELSRVAEIQLTAMDSVLASYILANDPRELNLNTYRAEFTNVKGSVPAVGILGSISYDNEPFLLSPCAESRLGFSTRPVSQTCQ